MAIPPSLDDFEPKWKAPAGILPSMETKSGFQHLLTPKLIGEAIEYYLTEKAENFSISLAGQSIDKNPSSIINAFYKKTGIRKIIYEITHKYEELSNLCDVKQIELGDYFNHIFRKLVKSAELLDLFEALKRNNRAKIPIGRDKDIIFEIDIDVIDTISLGYIPHLLNMHGVFKDKLKLPRDLAKHLHPDKRIEDVNIMDISKVFYQLVNQRGKDSLLTVEEFDFLSSYIFHVVTSAAMLYDKDAVLKKRTIYEELYMTSDLISLTLVSLERPTMSALQNSIKKVRVNDESLKTYNNISSLFTIFTQNLLVSLADPNSTLFESASSFMELVAKIPGIYQSLSLALYRYDFENKGKNVPQIIDYLIALRNVQNSQVHQELFAEIIKFLDYTIDLRVLEIKPISDIFESIYADLEYPAGLTNNQEACTKIAKHPENLHVRYVFEDEKDLTPNFSFYAIEANLNKNDKYIEATVYFETLSDQEGSDEKVTTYKELRYLVNLKENEYFVMPHVVDEEAMSDLTEEILADLAFSALVKEIDTLEERKRERNGIRNVTENLSPHSKTGTRESRKKNYKSREKKADEKKNPDQTIATLPQRLEKKRKDLETRLDIVIPSKLQDAIDSSTQEKIDLYNNGGGRVKIFKVMNSDVRIMSLGSRSEDRIVFLVKGNQAIYYGTFSHQEYSSTAFKKRLIQANKNIFVES